MHLEVYLDFCQGRRIDGVKLVTKLLVIVNRQLRNAKYICLADSTDHFWLIKESFFYPSTQWRLLS